jgi:hypothetical protein
MGRGPWRARAFGAAGLIEVATLRLSERRRRAAAAAEAIRSRLGL